MNDYKKKAEKIMAFGDSIIAEKKRIKAVIRRTVYSAAGLCALFAVCFCIWKNGDIHKSYDINVPEPSCSIISDTTESVQAPVTSAAGTVTTEENVTQTVNSTSAQTTGTQKAVSNAENEYVQPSDDELYTDDETTVAVTETETVPQTAAVQTTDTQTTIPVTETSQATTSQTEVRPPNSGGDIPGGEDPPPDNRSDWEKLPFYERFPSGKTFDDKRYTSTPVSVSEEMLGDISDIIIVEGWESDFQFHQCITRYRNIQNINELEVIAVLPLEGGEYYLYLNDELTNERKDEITEKFKGGS